MNTDAQQRGAEHGAAPRSIIVGTAGHIDHGKSCLVEALTGTHPDRLEEEKRRGITIDLGFAHLVMHAAGRTLHFGLVDVPGHERFVRNMLAGIGGIDLVLLVIAADESIRPQTREHFEICRLLGVRRGIVVLTKADLVDAELLELARMEAEEFVRGSFLEGAPIVAVSARTGAGMDKLRAALAETALTVPGRDQAAPFRLPIDRVFAVKGFGTVVTGTLTHGRIDTSNAASSARDFEVELFGTTGAAQGPVEGRRLRLRGLQVHGQPAAIATAGQRTALNLGGIETHELRRGMVLAEPGVFRLTSRLDIELTLLPTAAPLKHRGRVHLHLYSSETVATVLLLEAGRLGPDQTGLAQLLLAEPTVAVPGDRVILRQFSPVVTIGGGRVLENLPPRHRALRYAEAAAFLRRYDHADRAGRVLLLCDRAGPDGISVPAIAAALGARADDLEATFRALQAARQLFVAAGAPPVCLAESHALPWTRAMLQKLAEFHAAQPLLAGLPAEDLRGRLAPGRRHECPPLVFRALLERLIGEGRIEAVPEGLRLPGRGVTLTAEEAQARERIEAAFAAAGLKVPAVKEVLASTGVDATRAQRILTLLLREGRLVRINADLVFHPQAMDELKRALAARKALSPRINVADFKEMTGVSRKYAIPLLEHLDRLRLTKRVGDERVIL